MLQRVVAVALLLALAGQAHAQRAEAQDAFERGRKLMKEGEFKAACAAFETSLRLDPTTGTLYNLGLCHEKLGKLASAWTELKQVAESDTNKARAADAAKRVAALEPRLTRFRLVIAKRVEGLVIERDGIDVTALVGKEVPVDPRRYGFKASAPGRDPVEFDVELDREGETIDVDIPKLSKSDKPDDPVAPVASGEYPSQLALRPLTLPSGTYEVSAANVASTSDSTFEQSPIEGSIAARIGIQKFELGLGVTVHERYPQVMETRPSPLQTIAGTLAYSITPVFAGRLEYTKVHPVGDIGAGSDLRVLLAHKQLLAPRIALDGTAGFVFIQRDDGGDGESELIGEVIASLQFTVTKRLALEGAVALQLNLGGSLFDHTVTLGVGPRALFAMTDKIDLFARIFLGLLPAVEGGSSSDLRIYAIGLNWRP